MSLKDIVQRLTGRGSRDDSSTTNVARAVEDGDPTRTIVTDEEPPPIEQG